MRRLNAFILLALLFGVVQGSQAEDQAKQQQPLLFYFDRERALTLALAELRARYPGEITDPEVIDIRYPGQRYLEFRPGMENSPLEGIWIMFMHQSEELISKEGAVEKSRVAGNEENTETHSRWSKYRVLMDLYGNVQGVKKTTGRTVTSKGKNGYSGESIIDK